MPVEGISMTTVFSLVTVGMALSISVFIGGSYLQPSLDISRVMAGVAYDLASLYDIAYTMPGEVTMRYYGPAVCMWNTNQDPNSARSFHCFSGGAVVIDDVVLDKELLFVYNDTYMRYDYEKCLAESGYYCVPPEAVTTVKPAYGLIRIPFYNAQLCSYGGSGFGNCDEAVAPFAASFLDYSFLTDPLQSVEVENFAFVVRKELVNGYYESVSQTPENPISLIDLIECLSYFYNYACDTTSFYNPYDAIIGDKGMLCRIRTEGEDYDALMIREGYRWHVYNNASGSPTVICQERLSLEPEANPSNASYLIVDNSTMPLNNYTVIYCFDTSTIIKNAYCSNVKEVIIDESAVIMFNEKYDYYASSVSCLKPLLTFDGYNIIIFAEDVKYNQFRGECE